MISINKKIEINKILSDFEYKIKFGEKLINDSKLPSINLWRFYNEYLDNVLNVYSIKENEKAFIELFDKADLDHLYIDAHKPEDEMREYALSYIEEMKKVFKL